MPSVKQQLEVLIPFLKRHRQPLAPVHGKQPQIAVVEDANTSDLYKNSLYEDFKAELPGLPEDAYHPYSYVPGGLAPGGQFASITAYLCREIPRCPSCFTTDVSRSLASSSSNWTTTVTARGSRSPSSPAGSANALLAEPYQRYPGRRQRHCVLLRHRAAAAKQAVLHPVPGFLSHHGRASDLHARPTYDAVTAACEDINKHAAPRRDGHATADG